MAMPTPTDAELVARAQGGESRAFAELLDHDFVGLESNTVISQIMLEQASRAGKPLKLRVQVKSFDVVAKMIQAGLGIGILLGQI